MKHVAIPAGLLLLLSGSTGGCSAPGVEPHHDAMQATAGEFAGDGGVRLFYRVVPGPGAAVVVIHGGPGIDAAYLEPDLAPLARTRTLVFYDQRGAGRSELPEDPALLTMDHHVRDLEQLRLHLKLERLTLLAHSFGPLLAASYALAHPDHVERMIFIGPLPPWQGNVWEQFSAAVASRLSADEQASLARASEQLLHGDDPVSGCRDFWAIALRPRLADPDGAGVLKGDLCAAPPAALRHGMAVTNAATMASLGNWDMRAALATVDAPTLVIHGEQEAIPMQMVEEWITSLPHARLLRVAHAAHFPYVEQPGVVWPEIEAFLAEQP